MNRNIEFKGFDPNAQIGKVIERNILKLERLVGTFSPDLTYLRVFAEQIAPHKLYRISLTFEVPGRTLAARREQHDLKAGMRAAFEDIQDQLHKRKAQLRNRAA